MSLFDEDELNKGGAGCFACRLWRKCKAPKMSPVGEGKEGLLIISDSPSEEADKRHDPLLGVKTYFLFEEFKKYDIDLHTASRILYAVRCTTKGKDPSTKQIGLCRANLWREIQEYPPRVVVLLGPVALQSYLGDKWKKNLGEFSRWKGLSFFDKKAKAWVVPITHPKDLFRFENDEALLIEWRAHLEKIIDLLECETSDDLGKFPSTQLLYGDDRVRYLKDLLKRKPKCLAFDYETNCIRPQLKDSEIYSIAFADDRRVGTAMLFDKTIEPWVIKVLRDKAMGKIASNMKFEDTWTRVKLKTSVRNWVHDTMLFAHIEDNRPLYSGLKFQVFLWFGIVDYDSEIESFLNSEGKNGYNTIKKAPVEKILYYNALDAVFEYDLAMLQRKHLV